MNMASFRKKSITLGVVYVLVVIALIVICFPLLWVLLSSLKPIDEITTRIPRLFPTRISLEHYKELFKTDFFKWYQNSTVVAFSTTFIVIFFSTMGAYSISRFRFKTRNLMSSGVLLIYMFPSILLVIPLFLLLSKLRLTDNRLGLIFTYITFSLPYCLWLMIAFFKSIPTQLEEAALVDGATRLGALIHIIIPLALPGIISSGIFTFILCWNEYLFALILISSESLKTLPVGVTTFIGPTSVFWGLVLSATMLMTFPVLILFMFIQKQLITGISAGAIKG